MSQNCSIIIPRSKRGECSPSYSLIILYNFSVLLQYYLINFIKNGQPFVGKKYNSETSVFLDYIFTTGLDLLHFKIELPHSSGSQALLPYPDLLETHIGPLRKLSCMLFESGSVYASKLIPLYCQAGARSTLSTRNYLSTTVGQLVTTQQAAFRTQKTSYREL